MYLYHLSQSDYNGYDSYTDWVVAAENEEDARAINPDSELIGHPHGYKKLTCIIIGKALKEVERGVICASFINA